MPDKLAITQLLTATQAIFFIALLCAASVFDLRRRIIPDSINLSIAVSSLLCFFWGNLWGITVAVPFLLAAVFCGGMGGGDIKLMAACGLVLGLPRAIGATIVGLLLVLVYAAINKIICKVPGREAENAFPLAPFLSAGCVLAYFI